MVSDDPPVPRAGDTAQVFSSRTGEWQTKPLQEAEPESEFLFQGKLFRLRGKAGLIEWVTSVDVSKLADADRTFQPGDYRDPESTDVVYVVGKDARHVVLGAIQPEERFAFQGRLFEAKPDPSGEGLLIQYTGNTLNRVAQTFKRKTDALVDLTVRYEATGKDGVITGTPEHPFFVPAASDYVPMGKLTSGTQLRTSDGSRAVVLASNTRHGDFEVFNLEVENAHNYFVSPSGGGPGILVHNNCDWPVLERDLSGGKHASDTPLSDVIAEAGLRRAPPGHPREGLPVPVGRWSSPDAARAAASRVNPSLGRQVVPLLPGEGTVIHGSVSGYPPRLGYNGKALPPTHMEVPAPRALAIPDPLEHNIHIFPIDETHYLFDGPAGSRP
jgi:hypothetical protein